MSGPGCGCGTCDTCAGSSFRLAILPALAAADQVMATLDLVPTVVSIITRKWSGGQREVGTPGDTILRLPNWLVVEEISNREVMQSGGRFEMGDIRVGPIRPRYTADSCEGPGHPGGYTVDQLRPTTTNESTEFIYRLAQAHQFGTGWSGDYWLVELTREDPLEFFLVIRRRLENENTIPALDALNPQF